MQIFVKTLNGNTITLELKTMVPEEGDEDEEAGFADEASHASQPALTSAVEELRLVEQGGLDLPLHKPSEAEVKQCRREVPYYPWKILSGLSTYQLGSEKLSRAGGGYSWHLPQQTLDCMWDYFQHLEWSTQGKVSLFELFCDFYAFSGGVTLLNPKNRRATSAFASALRLMPRQFSPSIPATPATHTLVSHLTPFNLPKQAVGLNHRPKFRQPARVHAMLTWLRMQPEPFTTWRWNVPLNILLNN